MQHPFKNQHLNRYNQNYSIQNQNSNRFDQVKYNQRSNNYNQNYSLENRNSENYNRNQSFKNYNQNNSSHNSNKFNNAINAIRFKPNYNVPNYSNANQIIKNRSYNFQNNSRNLKNYSSNTNSFLYDQNIKHPVYYNQDVRSNQISNAYKHSSNVKAHNNDACEKPLKDLAKFNIPALNQNANFKNSIVKLEGYVNSCPVKILLDTGAEISAINYNVVHKMQGIKIDKISN